MKRIFGVMKLTVGVVLGGAASTAGLLHLATKLSGRPGVDLGHHGTHFIKHVVEACNHLIKDGWNDLIGSPTKEQDVFKVGGKL